MRYLTALPIFLFLFLLDLLVTTISAFLVFVPVFILAEEGHWPVSYKFAKGVWLD